MNDRSGTGRGGVLPVESGTKMVELVRKTAIVSAWSGSLFCVMVWRPFHSVRALFAEICCFRLYFALARLIAFYASQIALLKTSVSCLLNISSLT